MKKLRSFTRGSKQYLFFTGLLLVLLLTVPPLQYASSFNPTISDNGPAINQADHPDDDFVCDPQFEDCTTDSDGDGTPDWDDDCPTQAGPASNYGCPEGVEPDDSDGDGLYDYEDMCPYEPGPWEYEGCPTDLNDPDGDGIVGEFDDCPVLKEDIQFIQCFVCPNFQSRVMGKVLCKGDPL